MESLLDTAWWAPALIWAVLYTSDFTLTLIGRRAYRKLDGRFFQFDSYELTPFWKETIEKGRWLSPRFAVMLASTTLFVAFICWQSRVDLTPQAWVDFSLACLGGLFLVEAMIHIRHVRNIALFRSLMRGDGVEGHLRYPAWFSYSNSAKEAATFGIFYLLLAAADRSFFCLGGGLGVMALAIRHHRYAAAAHRTLLANTERNAEPLR